MARFAAALAFFHPEIEVLTFPAWDCLPYDRVSPNGEIVSRRIDTLTRLATAGGGRRAAGRADDGQCAGPARAAAAAIRRPGADAAAVGPDRQRPAAKLLSQQRLFPHRHGARARRVRGPRRHRRSLSGRRGTAVAARFFRRHDREHPQLRPADPALDRQPSRKRCCARSARCCSTTPAIQPLPHPLSRAVRRCRHRRSALRNRSAPGAAMSAWSIGCRSITSGSKPCSTTCPAPGCRSTTRPRRSAPTGSNRSPISMRRGTM